MLETFRDLNEIGAAIAAVRGLCDLPIVAQMTTEEDGNSLDGTPPEQFAPVLLARGAAIVGVNCSVGPAPMLESIERLAAVTDARLSALPNAGKPARYRGPQHLSLLAGIHGVVRAAVHRAVACAWSAVAAGPRPSTSGRSAPRCAARRLARSRATGKTRHARGVGGRARRTRSRRCPRGEIALAAKLAAGQFVFGVELVPPRGPGVR